MQTGSKNNNFQTWLDRLENGITNLSQDVPTGDPEKLSKQAATYESEILLLYEHAKLHQIDTGGYQTQFSRIDAHLKHVKTAIEVRTNGRLYQAQQAYRQGYNFGVGYYPSRYAAPIQSSYSHSIVPTQLQRNETPWWRKALGFIVGAISFLANLISLTPILTLLPWNGLRLLR